MTALAAYWDLGRAMSSPARRMLNAQAIYGKTDATAELGPVELGRRLWPMLPEDVHDSGPVVGCEGKVLLTADARIDNREDLVAALGLAPSSRSDAALVLAAYERWRNGAFARLIGAFAVIVWDARHKVLVLARDPLGERPLHWHRGAGFVAVASMPRGLHAVPDVPYAPDVTMTASFLALIPETGCESFFASIARVTPGTFIVIDGADVRQTAYWHPDSHSAPESGSDRAGAVRAALETAVKCRLRRAGGGLGTHLSAGLDSGAVTATAALLTAPEAVHAYTAVPSSEAPEARDVLCDEGPLAARVAALYPHIVHRRIASSARPVDLLDRQFELFQRPVLNPSNAVWNEAIGDAARGDGVTVLLTGQMGNFTISHDGLHHLPELAARGRLLALARIWSRMRRDGATLASLANLSFGPLLPHAWWIAAMRRFGRGIDLGDVAAIQDAAIKRHELHQRARQRGLNFAYPPWRDSRAMRMWGLQRVDMGVYLKGMLAGWGIDMRDPTADRRLIELTLAIPDAEFIRDGVPRSLARRAFADRLPADVLNERRRGLQAADWAAALSASRAALGEELAAVARCSAASDLLDIAALSNDLAQWPSSDLQGPAMTQRYRHRLLRAVAAGHFLRRVARTN